MEPGGPPALITQNMMEGDSDLRLVISKRLLRSDVSRHHGRLSIPIVARGEQLLTDEEEILISQGKSLQVTLVEPCLDETNMRLRKWDMWNNNSIYVLTYGWNLVLNKNRDVLYWNATVQLWSFRRNGRLWLVLVVVDEEGNPIMNGGQQDHN